MLNKNTNIYQADGRLLFHKLTMKLTRNLSPPSKVGNILTIASKIYPTILLKNSRSFEYGKYISSKIKMQITDFMKSALQQMTIFNKNKRR